MRKAGQAETGAHISEWLTSTGTPGALVHGADTDVVDVPGLLTRIVAAAAGEGEIHFFISPHSGHSPRGAKVEVLLPLGACRKSWFGTLAVMSFIVMSDTSPSNLTTGAMARPLIAIPARIFFQSILF